MFVKNLKKYQPKNEYSLFIKEYFWDMEIYGTKKFIENIDVELKFIEIDNFLIPLTFWNNKNNCYTASILWHLIYLKEELKNERFFLKRIIYHIFVDALLIIGRIFKIEESVYVCNLFLATILYPKIPQSTLSKINNFLKDKFPNKAIIYRGINSDITSDIKENLEKENFFGIVTRQIFYLKTQDFSIFSRKKAFVRDRNICKKWNFSIKKSDFSREDIDDMKKFYDDLYLEKYSFSNPQFSLDFYELILKNPYFSLNLIQNNQWGNEAIFGSYNIDKKLTNPVFWYKVQNNKEKRLYQQLTYLSIIEVYEKMEVLNLSSWVWEFKMHRWAKMDLEYAFILCEHLSFFRKIPWKILRFISEKILEKEFKNNIY